MKIWSLPKHENLTTGKKYCGKEEKLKIYPLFHNIFDISLTSKVQLHIYLLNVVVWIIFSSILQIWCVKVRISRSSSEGPLEFEITRVDCSLWKLLMGILFYWRQPRAYKSLIRIGRQFGYAERQLENISWIFATVCFCLWVTHKHFG